MRKHCGRYLKKWWGKTFRSPPCLSGSTNLYPFFKDKLNFNSLINYSHKQVKKKHLKGECFTLLQRSLHISGSSPKELWSHSILFLEKRTSSSPQIYAFLVSKYLTILQSWPARVRVKATNTKDVSGLCNNSMGRLLRPMIKIKET